MMRLVVLLLAMLTRAAAAAEPVDCAAIENAMAPLELTYHDVDQPFVTQVYRDKSGNSVVWIKTLNGKFVAKGVFVAGILAAGETTSTYAGRFKSSKIKYTVEGMPKLFDRRSNLKYRIAHSTVYADGSTDESSTTYDYRFKSAGRESVGPCMLDVVRGESDSVNEKTGKTSHTYRVFLPQLMTEMIGRAGEPVLDAIKTTFDPIIPIP